ncbi:MAG: hypothetical protein GXO47_10655, partial [Chlorobi bacterium]|nr:hypothetical protein [Chlorobiota bacterium]
MRLKTSMLLLFAVTLLNAQTGKTIKSSVQPYNSNRLFIKYGIQLGCWVGSENIKAERTGAAYYRIRSKDWKTSGFTSPTFFVPPRPFNKKFILEQFPESQWSMAKAPYGKRLDREPTEDEYEYGFLDDDQKKALSRLTTMCIGDEEYYSDTLITQITKWFNVARKHYPDVILHTNQFGYGGQWKIDQMRKYMRIAKPDMLTYDAYYFLPVGKKIKYYRGAKAMAEDLMLYRTVALEGHDGTGNNPIAFGQYTQGYKQGGTYEISESELRLYYSMTWVFGGKWLNWFRWLQGNEDINGKTLPNKGGMLLENGKPGKYTKQMDWVSKCNSESKAIGNHLVRLITDNVVFIKGDKELTNGTPKNIEKWESGKLNIFNNISSKCLYGKYKNKRADIYIGTF